MSDARRVGSAEILLDASGVARSARFDDIYHSADGAALQAQHVFLRGNRLPARWRGRSTFTIVETGFGLGVNFLATWMALRSDPDGPPRLHYISVEQHPPGGADLDRFYALNADCAELGRELIGRWPPSTRGFHRIEFDAGRLALTLLIGDAAAMLAELDARADALYLDGFAPEKNPAMWSDALFRELARLSARGTTAATWSVAAAVRARLANAGFHVAKRPGFGRKREMLTAERLSGPAASAPARAKHAIVLGAGLAGVWCAHALARRGWEIELVERFPEPAQGASGNAAGAVRPALNLADNDNAQIARAGFLLATRSLAIAGPAGAWSQTGVVHVATNASQASRMAQIDQAHAFPPQYAALIDAREASQRVGSRVAGPGFWLPLGGWAQPGAVCAALLALEARRISARFGLAAIDVAYRANRWQVIGTQGVVIAQAPTLILAAGHEMSRLQSLALPPLLRVRGQVSYLPPSPARSLDAVVCGDGYVAPLPGGGHCVGATFDPGDADDALRVRDHCANLARLERMLPGFGAGLAAAALDGRAGVRTATADRLPACGALKARAPDAEAEGLYVVTGLGARGLVFAPLCAEIIAADLDREPNLLERRLIHALDPSRLFARRDCRAMPRSATWPQLNA